MGGVTSDADTALLLGLYSWNDRLMFTGTATINIALQRDKKTTRSNPVAGVVTARNQTNANDYESH